MTVGEKIKKLRKDLRYTQQAFADLVGISQTAISHYELGRKHPRLSSIKKIMAFAKKNNMKINLLD